MHVIILFLNIKSVFFNFSDKSQPTHIGTIIMFSILFPIYTPPFSSFSSNSLPLKEKVRLEMEGASLCRFTNICVFCGSSPGKGIEFLRAANSLGRVLAARKVHVVYGGGSIGLMGVVAPAAQ